FPSSKAGPASGRFTLRMHEVARGVRVHRPSAKKRRLAPAWGARQSGKRQDNLRDTTIKKDKEEEEEDDDDDNEGQPQCWLLWLLWLLRKCSLPRPRPAALAVAMLEMAGPAQVGPPARQQESWLCCRRCWSW
ncbi:unnamed protein product, partial [Prorocentrum cordatum]